MIEIIDSREAAREAIKVRLEKEIPPINKAIQQGKSEGKIWINYEDGISEPTVKILNKAGYEVSGWINNENVQISWSHAYEELCKKTNELEKIAKELDIKIAEVQQQQPRKREK